MVRTAIGKNNIREIFRSPGRYFAILGIILLGAGFFTGLRVTRDAIVKTADTAMVIAATQILIAMSEAVSWTGTTQ